MSEASFPVDDVTLDLLISAMNTAYGADHELVGGDFTLTQLLQLYSGYDESKLIPLGKKPNPIDGESDVEWYLNPVPQYHEHDVIRALIAEVKRLRAIVGDDGFSAPEK